MTLLDAVARISGLMVWGNVVVFGAIAWRQWQVYRVERRPMALIYLFLGLSWTALYLYVGLVNLEIVKDIWGSVWFGRIFVRPLFLMTGVLMLIHGEMRRAAASRKAGQIKVDPPQ